MSAVVFRNLQGYKRVCSGMQRSAGVCGDLLGSAGIC